MSGEGQQMKVQLDACTTVISQTAIVHAPDTHQMRHLSDSIGAASRGALSTYLMLLGWLLYSSRWHRPLGLCCAVAPELRLRRSSRAALLCACV